MTHPVPAARTHRVAPSVLLLLLACGPKDSPLEPVIVADTQAPTAVLEVLDGSGGVIADGRAGFGEALSLDGAGSTDAGGGRIVEYVWSLPDGSVVETVGSRLAVSDVVTDPFPVGGHTFGLTVTDDSDNRSTPALVTVIVVDIQAPTAVVELLDASGAVAANGRVAFGAAFSLDGSRSADVGGQIAQYEWSLPDGTTETTDTPTLAVTDVLTAHLPVAQHTFGLTVTDDSNNRSTPTQVTVIVVDIHAPTAVVQLLDASGAVAANGRVAFGAAFSLDGSRSADVGGQIAQYEWSLPDGTTETTDTPTLVVTDVVTTPFLVGRHGFELTVIDNSNNRSTPVQVSVIVVDTQAPTAVVELLDASGAVDANGRVPFGSAFSLDGSRSSDVGGQIVRYEWLLPDGRTVVDTAPTLAVTDVVTDPFPVGGHTFGLTVEDDSGNESTLAELTIIVVDTQAPTAVVQLLDASGAVDADGRVPFGSAFSLDGSRSTDVGGQIVRYEWSLPDGRSVVNTAPTLAVTDFVTTPFGVGQHTFGLTVEDDSGNESTLAELTIIVVDTQAPTAVLTVTDAAGRPLVGSVRIGSSFSLSGRRSVDVGGQITQYEWSLPDGTTVATTVPTLAVTDIVRSPFGVGQHTFGLTVTDDSDNESTLVQVTVTVVF